MTDFVRQQREAALSLAKTALANPYLFPEGGELTDARRNLAEAQERLKLAEKRWLALIEPATGWAPDPLRCKK